MKWNSKATIVRVYKKYFKVRNMIVYKRWFKNFINYEGWFLFGVLPIYIKRY